jgi:hypothetical protein
MNLEVLIKVNEVRNIEEKSNLRCSCYRNNWIK